MKLKIIFTLLFLSGPTFVTHAAAPTVDIIFHGTSAQGPQENVINARFNVTAAGVRKAFDEFELKGEKQAKVNVGQERSIQVPANAKTFTLSIRFLSPLDQARMFGYEFGLVAKNRTAADRKDFEDRKVERIVKDAGLAAFVVKLLPVPDPSIDLPEISFLLVDHQGHHITPLTAPSEFSAAVNDLFADAALEEDGQPLIFPVTADSGALITNKMDSMTLLVKVAGQTASLQYALK